MYIKKGDGVDNLSPFYIKDTNKLAFKKGFIHYAFYKDR